MLPRRHRLRRRIDVQRVRRQGRRWRHPLAILLALPSVQKMNQTSESNGHNRIADSRFAFAASRRVGKAVARNRAKRLLRAAVSANLTEIDPGWDCLLIARERTSNASYADVERAVQQLLVRAKILTQHTPTSGDSGA